MKITLCKDGEDERDVDLDSISIPDLWHLAQVLPDIFRWAELPEDRGGDGPAAGQRKGERAAESVLECWHLCHDLLRTLLERDTPTT